MKEYLKLLAKREGRIVLGHRCANLWLLSIVLMATFLSIAFSNGSMLYLSEKMNDPFTNWVNIAKAYESDDFEGLRIELQNPDILARYGINDVQGDNYMSYTFIGKNESTHYLECRFFGGLNTPLVKAILAEDNVVGNCAMSMNQIYDNSLGLIITQDVLEKLGYSVDSIPAYINYMSHSENADTLGIKLYEGKYAAAPMPLLGVVRRLPMNMDVIGAHYFYEQYNNIKHPFNLSNEKYSRELYYFVIGDDTLTFNSVVEDLVPKEITRLDIEDEEVNYLKSWKKGVIKRIYEQPDAPTEAYVELNKRILNNFSSDNVIRLYCYDVSSAPLPERRYLSVNFSSLDSIRAFENYSKENFKVQIDMTQVASKENFNAVSVMANILSWAMIVFSMVCIIMFIVNMLQSYFQKVKRNMGTFKAFGISSTELINVYVLILLSIIFIAIFIALVVSWGIQLFLPLLGILKDGEYNYLYLWNMKTVWSVVIVVVATLMTVRIVMGRLLRQTPGDLIYDR